MTAYLSFTNKETGIFPLFVNQGSLVMEKINYVLLLSMIPQYAVNLAPGVSH